VTGSSLLYEIEMKLSDLSCERKETERESTHFELRDCDIASYPPF